jgi:hypothetical protein
VTQPSPPVRFDTSPLSTLAQGVRNEIHGPFLSHWTRIMMVTMSIVMASAGVCSGSSILALCSLFIIFSQDMTFGRDFICI